METKIMIKVKQKKGNSWMVVDRVSMKPNKARDYINLKYCGKLSKLNDKFKMVMQMTEDEFINFFDKITGDKK